MWTDEQVIEVLSEATANRWTLTLSATQLDDILRVCRIGMPKSCAACPKKAKKVTKTNADLAWDVD